MKDPVELLHSRISSQTNRLNTTSAPRHPAVAENPEARVTASHGKDGSLGLGRVGSSFTTIQF